MPYRLTVDLNSLARKKTKRGFAYNSVDQLVYFVRVSAVNAELGEGPYSNIVELKKMDISNTTTVKFNSCFTFSPRYNRVRSTTSSRTSSSQFVERTIKMGIPLGHNQAFEQKLSLPHALCSPEQSVLLHVIVDPAYLSGSRSHQKLAVCLLLEEQTISKRAYSGSNQRTSKQSKLPTRSTASNIS